MKALGLLLMGGLMVGGGYWWWSSRPTEPLAFENARPLELEPVQERVKPRLSIESEEALEGTPLAPGPSASLPPTPVPQPTVEINERLIGFGLRTPPSPRKVDAIVLHSSYNAAEGDRYDVEQLINQYEREGMSSHYLIDRHGTIYQLVRESHIAYHVGQSKLPDGRTNGNDVSIGIELMGTEESGFTEKQYASLNQLVADIKTRWSIRHLVAHSDISTAPARKTDPWKFDWKKVK